MGWKPSTVVDSLDDFLLVDVLRKWQLYDEAIDVAVVVQPSNALQQLCLGDVGLVADERALESAGLASQHFVLHVCLAAAIVSYEDGCQMGLLASTSHDLLYFLFDLRLDGCGSSLSVNQLHNFL